MGKSLLKIHKVNLDDLPLEFKYYSVKVNFNYEREAAKNIKNNMIARGYGDYVDDIIVPLVLREETKINKAGKPVTKQKWDKVFGLDGIIWVKMILNSSTWSVVRNSTGVAGWYEADGRPLALNDAELISIKKAIGLYEKEVEEAVNNFDATIGDLIKIVDGAMAGFEGELSEIDKVKKTIKVKMPNGMTFQAGFHQAKKV